MHPILRSMLLLLAIHPSLAQSPPPPETSLYSNSDGTYPKINMTTNIIFFFVGLVMILIFITSLHRCRRSRLMAVRMQNEAILSEISHGIDPSHLNSFPLVEYAQFKGQEDVTDPSECTICLSEYTNSDTLRVLPGCHHGFHQYCIDKWLVSYTTCPVCRSDLTYTVWQETDSHVINIEAANVYSYISESSGNLKNDEDELRVSESGAGNRVGSFTLQLSENVQRETEDAGRIQQTKQLGMRHEESSEPDVIEPIAS